MASRDDSFAGSPTVTQHSQRSDFGDLLCTAADAQVLTCDFVTHMASVITNTDPMCATRRPFAAAVGACFRACLNVMVDSVPLRHPTRLAVAHA